MTDQISRKEDLEVLSNDEITLKQRRIGYLKQFTFGMIASMSNFIFGCHNSNRSVTVQALSSPEAFVYLDTAQQSIFATISSIFGMVSCLIASYAVAMAGPKSCLMVSVVLSAIGGILTVVAQNPAMLHASRALHGLGEGAASPLLFIYIRDIAETDIRCRLLTLPIFMSTMGSICLYFVAAFVSWWTLQMLLLSATVIILVAMCFIPESPMWFNNKGKIEKAKSSMKRLRPNGYDVEDELSHIPTSQKEKFYFILLLRLFRKSKYVKPFMYMAFINILEFLCAGIVALSFTTVILNDIGDVMNPSIAASIVAMANLVGICLAFQFIDKIGRKPLLMLSTLIMSSTWLAMAAFIYVKYNYPSYAEGKEYLKILALFVNMLGCGLGCRIVPGILMSETIPKEVNAVGTGLITVLQFLSCSGVLALFLYMVDNYRQGEVYFLYTGFCFLTVFLTHFFITETNQKTLREIETLFEKKRAFFEAIVPSVETIEMRLEQLDEYLFTTSPQRAKSNTAFDNQTAQNRQKF